MAQPSDVVVTDFDTLAQNFYQNSVSAVCSLAIGTGTYAIGARALGLAKFTPQTAIATTAAMMAALALCPSGANQQEIMGTPPPFTGGQCPVSYHCVVDYRFNSDVANGNPGIPSQEQFNTIGPLSLRKRPDGSSAGRFFYEVVNGNGSVPWQFQLNPSKGDTFSMIVTRNDGQSDNCGSLPREGGQIITNNEGDTINQTTIQDNSNKTIVFPVNFNLGGISGVINMPFSNVRIAGFLPLTFKINIGGTDFGFKRKPDGTGEPYETNPDEKGTTDELTQLLKEIKICVCKPDVDLDMLYLPVVDSETSCDVTTARFLVPKGSVSEEAVAIFQTSAQLASSKCEEVSPIQLEESLLFAATITTGGKELFTPLIDNQVISLRVKITDYNENLLPKISLYPDSDQRKFGSVSYVGASVSGGGDYIYVFDTNTYIPLPSRGKKGRLRVLFKPGTSFEVYDTGERL